MDYEGWRAYFVRIQKSKFAVIRGVRRTASFYSSFKVNAISICQLQILLKVVDVSARELGCDVPDRTPEDRVHEVLLFEEGTLVVGAFASVVEGKDAGVFSTYQVCSLVLPAGGIVRMGRVEWRFRPSALGTALVNVRLVG